MAKWHTFLGIAGVAVSAGLLFIYSMTWQPASGVVVAKENRLPGNSVVGEFRDSVVPSVGGNGLKSDYQNAAAEEFHPTINKEWLENHGFKSGQDTDKLRALLNGQTELKPPAALHSIGISPSSDAQAIDSKPSLLAQQRYLHASLPSEWLAGSDSVIVRWRRVSDGVVMELSAQSTPDGSSASMPIWMFRSTDWPLGSYRLEIIRPDPALEQIAAGDFTITNDSNAVSPVSFSVESSN